MSTIRVTFVGPRQCRILLMSSVFLDRTYSYLLVRSGDRYNHYLRLHEGTVELIRFHKESELVLRLRPYPKHGLRKAAQVYMSSPLPKTDEAQAVLESILASTDDDQMNFVFDASEKQKLDRPSRQERQAKKANQVSLEQICEELEITPNRARGIFRRNNIDKPGARWEWNKSERDQVVKMIKKFL